VPDREWPDAVSRIPEMGERAERWTSERRGVRSGPNARRANASERGADRTLDERTPWSEDNDKDGDEERMETR